MIEDSHHDIETVLRKYFGYTQFRIGQREVIEAALSMRDVLAIMPTGSGKSLCYQIPALLFKGLTIVISPLISLMQDQVSALQEAGIPAALLNSSLSHNEFRITVENVIAGHYKILYVAPERLLNEQIFLIASSVPISMIIIDEAHCVSQWGHDFRPSYLHIVEFIDRLSMRPVISAFTATATLNVRSDICKALKLQNPFTLLTGFDRGNLYFEVQHLSSAREKERSLLSYIKMNSEKSGIIYCLTRKTVEEVCETLIDNHIDATRYHAGLDEKERYKNQDDFIYDRKNIMVATCAFGMGIDKSNVSFVIHYNMPKNIESYYQEAGRAGRDGGSADCILFYSPQDVVTNKWMIEKSAGDENSFLSPAEINATKNRNLELLKLMTYYCTTKDCLRSYIIKYFGDTALSYCGRCSNCLSNFESIDITLDAKKIISCVYRIEQRSAQNQNNRHAAKWIPPALGKTMIIDILRGSKNQKILENNYNTLSTYGIMADTSAARIRQTLDYLIDLDYLSLDGTEYPVVMRCKKSEEVIKPCGNFKLEIKLPKVEEQVAVRAEVHKSETENIDTELLEKLKKLRAVIAAKSKVPSYIVFTDATLKDMCIKLPSTKEDFLNVCGVGSRKLQQYGEAFIKEIRGHVK